MSDVEDKLLSRRSGLIFMRLHHLAEAHPELRPGQILQLVGISVPDGVDPFYWEITEWAKRIDAAERRKGGDR